MQYFRYQTPIAYQFTEANANTVLVMTDITQHARIAERLRQYQSSFYDYVVQDGERPDAVAQKLYGSSDYTWVVLLVNNIMSLYDWPLTYIEFNNYIVGKYGSLDAAQTGTKTYYTTDGIQVDATTYTTLPIARRGEIRTPYDEEFAQNEAKRRIKAVSRGFVGKLAEALRTLYR